MSEWNAMTYEGKDTILRVVRNEAERFFALAERPDLWHAQSACDRWTTADVVGHIVDTTEGYFRAFDAARGTGEVGEPHGLPAMSELANEGATSFRGASQDEMMERIRTDFHKMQE
ncbi:MAG TPA: maleylpyruvate isomerase N-terminal domain-containing protein, partial [Nocardioidaceae bacterium]